MSISVILIGITAVLCFAARFGVAMALAVAILALLRLYYARLRMSCLESSE